MTAQVFRNGQQQTFYVSDALAPSGSGGIDGTFQNVTAAQDITAGRDIAVGRFLYVASEAVIASPNAANPTLVIQGAAGSTRAGLEVAVVGSGLQGVVKADTTVVPKTFTTGSAAGVDYSLQSGGVKRLTVPFTGIANDPSATAALTVDGITNISSIQIQSGSYVPVWTTTAGFLGAGAATGFYIRLGNYVHVTFQVLAVSAALGANTANVTLPIAPAAPFGGSEAIGDASMQTPAPASANATLVTAQPGTTQVRVAVTAQAPYIAIVTASFIYRLA